MIYEIKKYGTQCLRELATPVDIIDEKILEIIDNMVETMHESKGVGLAAPQVGINKRIFVCDRGDGIVRKIINPIITPISDEKIDFEEGCLSVPGIYKKVSRFSKIKIEYINEKNENVVEEVSDFLAIIMQHEYDHLDGILFIDKISPIAKRMIDKKLQFLKKESLKQQKEILTYEKN